MISLFPKINVNKSFGSIMEQVYLVRWNPLTLVCHHSLRQRQQCQGGEQLPWVDLSLPTGTCSVALIPQAENDQDSLYLSTC